MARILIYLRDEELLKTVTDALAETKHTVTTVDDLGQDSGSVAVADNIMSREPDVVIMEYWREDMAGVKLLETLSDREHRPEVIFIETEGETPYAELLMAFSEGVRGFLPHTVPMSALVRYVDRAAAGLGGLLPRSRSDHDDSQASALLEEQLGATRLKSGRYQKLIAYLLATPVGNQARKVLVVSDSAYQLEMLKKILEEYNFSTFTAGNIADGLNIALSERPRIIVSDLELEGQTGLEFCQTVKFTNKITPCHFVICTANQDKVSKVMTPGNGVDDCLIKPSGQSQSDTMQFISRVALGLLL